VSAEEPTILIVDDEPENRILLEGFLVPQGYRVVTAADGAQAIAEVHAAAPDLILLDVMMPGRDGFDVCRELKANPATWFIPVVMVTALSDRDDRIRGIEAGADDFLSKPVYRWELLTRTKSLLRIKRLHDDLQKSYEQLKKLEDLRDRLIQLLIHDLKGPLTSLLLGVDLLISHDGEPAIEGKHWDLLRRMRAQIGELTHMVQSLLDIARMEEGKLPLQPEVFPVTELVQNLLGEFEVPYASKGVALEGQVSSDLRLVHADRDLLKRVLANLVKNALEYTPTNGRVIVDAREEDAGWLRIWVEDTGVGIPEALQGKIFEKFGQVHLREARQRRGTGLGLTLCKLAIEAHGGRIWVESQEGKGSRFSFTIPCLSGETTDADGGDQ
jgi:two-component system, sensor histidine kinase and response regulator